MVIFMCFFLPFLRTSSPFSKSASVNAYLLSVICRVLRFFVGFTLLFATIYVVFEPAERPGFNLIGVGNSPPFFRDEETITTVYEQFSALKDLSSTILTFCNFRQFHVTLEIIGFQRFLIDLGRTMVDDRCVAGFLQSFLSLKIPRLLSSRYLSVYVDLFVLFLVNCHLDLFRYAVMCKDINDAAAFTLSSDLAAL